MIRGLLRAGWCVGVFAALGCGEPGPLDGMRSAGRHPEGWAEASGHGPWLKARGYPLEACAGCHVPTGLAEDGACNACHTRGVEDCNTCHAQPPGAHRAHGAFACATCHPVPGSLHTPGHLEDRGPEDVRLAGLALGRGLSPRFDGQRCSDTACHAGPGAANPNPSWQDGPQGCGDCHGNPPPAHPLDRCDRCHGEVVDAVGGLIHPDRHVDGRLQARDWLAFGCGECHGAGDDPWPVSGAHPAHKAPTGARPVACATCHRVPARSEDPGHVLQDDTPGAAEVVLSGAAGPEATYADGRCSDATCHGPARPRWEGSAECGSCHGLPPPAHPPGDCARCHPTAAPGGGIARPLDHVDGRLDVDHLDPAGCADCHAEGAPAYPAGSHLKHRRFACGECHQAPDPAALAAHLDGDPVLILRRGGRVEGTRCADSGCHGFGAPDWADPGSVSGCGACHGEPPAGHAAGPCVQCHPLGDATHVDGVVQVRLPTGCADCHGMPPDSGSHRAHLASRDFAPIGCADCHRVPTAVEDPGHLDPPPAEVSLVGGRYDPAAGRCADTVCHGGPGGFRPAPRWAGDPLAGTCGACHGVPPDGHPPGNCATCHGSVIDFEGRIIAPRLHANGRVDLR